MSRGHCPPHNLKKRREEMKASVTVCSTYMWSNQHDTNPTSWTCLWQSWYSHLDHAVHMGQTGSSLHPCWTEITKLCALITGVSAGQIHLMITKTQKCLNTLILCTCHNWCLSSINRLVLCFTYALTCLHTDIKCIRIYPFILYQNSNMKGFMTVISNYT